MSTSRTIDSPFGPLTLRVFRDPSKVTPPGARECHAVTLATLTTYVWDPATREELSNPIKINSTLYRGRVDVQWKDPSIVGDGPRFYVRCGDMRKVGAEYGKDYISASASDKLEAWVTETWDILRADPVEMATAEMFNALADQDRARSKVEEAERELNLARNAFNKADIAYNRSEEALRLAKLARDEDWDGHIARAERALGVQ